MKLTNRMRLPEPIVRAVSNDSYTKGNADISVTELLTPPWMRHLKVRHDDEIEEDVSDRIWSLLGSSVHSIIERASNEDDVLSEATLYMEMEGWKIKGQADHVTLSKAELCDFKVTTAYKITNNRVPLEWVQQTNIYRYMLGLQGVVINSIAIIVILRDWSKREAARREDYPQAQVVRLEVPIWDEAKTVAFIRDRVLLHQDADPSPCTDEEIWAKPTRFAVMKRGRLSAIRLLDDEGAARELADQTLGGYVDVRPGEAIRCANYCAVAPFCSKWRDDPRNQLSVNAEVEGLFA